MSNATATAPDTEVPASDDTHPGQDRPGTTEKGVNRVPPKFGGRREGRWSFIQDVLGSDSVDKRPLRLL